MQNKSVFLLLLFCTMPLFAEKGLEMEDYNFSIYAGFGFSYYYDNMKINRYTATAVDQLSYWGFSGKAMWEPEHRLSVGLELGYYQLYEYNDVDNSKKRAIDTYCTPILLNINMRIIDNFSLGIGTGLVSLKNNIAYLNDKDVEHTKGITDSKIWSIANYSFSANYLLPMNKLLNMLNLENDDNHIIKRSFIGLESQYLWIGKTNDNMLTLQILLGYRL